MRQGRIETLPRLRRSYKNAEELGAVINRGRKATIERLKTGNFTQNEKNLIAADLVKKNRAENIAEALTFLEA